VCKVTQFLAASHYIIGGLDGIDHVTISVGIFVIGNESVGQTKVDFYCIPWMAALKSGGIESLHFMTGTRWVQQNSVEAV